MQKNGKTLMWQLMYSYMVIYIISEIGFGKKGSVKVTVVILKMLNVVLRGVVYCLMCRLKITICTC